MGCSRWAHGFGFLGVDGNRAGDVAVADMVLQDGVFCSFSMGKPDGGHRSDSALSSLCDATSIAELETDEIEVGAALAVLGSPARGKQGGRRSARGGKSAAVAAAGAGEAGAGAVAGSGLVRYVEGDTLRMIVSLSTLPEDIIKPLRQRLDQQPTRSSRRASKRARETTATSSAATRHSSRRRVGSVGSAASASATKPDPTESSEPAAPAVAAALPDASPKASGAALLLAGFGSTTKQ